MKRRISFSESLFIFGLGLLLIFMLIHDWVPLGSLNNVQAIQLAHTKSELVQMTTIQTLSILIVIIIAVIYIGKRYPIWAKLWLIIHLGCIMVGAIFAWWIPYFFGSSEERVGRYNFMFGDTHSFLPAMNGIVPNTIHVLFHLTLLLTWILSIYIGLKKPKEKEYSINLGR